MANHVIIWQGNQDMAGHLANGIAANNYPDVRIVCANDPEIRAAFASISCFDWPSPPVHHSNSDAAWAEAWKIALQTVYLDIARNTAAHSVPGTVVLSFVIPAECSGDSWQTLQHMAAGARLLGSMDFVIHAIVLIKTESAWKEEQIRLLEAFQKDLREKHTVLPAWNRLSFLSDWSATGSASPEIAQNREDILAGVIVNASADIRENQNACVTYCVQSTNFGKSDLNMLPRQMLYDIIKQRAEESQTPKEVATKLFPDEKNIADALHAQLNQKNFPLVSALLADDDNYRSRTSAELANEFFRYNGVTLADALDVETEADKWLAAAKHQLATWIAVGDSARSYIRPGGTLEADLEQKITVIEVNLNKLAAFSRKNAQVSAVPLPQHVKLLLKRQNDAPMRIMPFGSKVSPLMRLKYARKLAEDIKLRAVQFGLTRYLKAVEQRLPLLNEYYETIARGNEELFGKRSDMAKAYEAYEERQSRSLTDSGETDEEKESGKTLRQELENYDLSNLTINQNQTDTYKESLEEALNANPLPHARLLSDQTFFDTDAPKHVHKEGYLMLNKALMLPKEQHDLAACPSCAFLGASTHFYKLTTYPLDLERVSVPDAFMDQTTKADNVAVAPVPLRKTSAGWNNIDITLTWNGANYVLHWNWPEKVRVLWLEIMTDEHHHCYQTCVHAQLGHRGQHIIGVSSLPQGKTIRVCFDETKDRNGQHAEKTVTVPQITQQLSLQKKTGIGAAMCIYPSLWKWIVALPELLIPGVPASQCRLELHIENHTFHYPIPKNVTEFHLWSKRNEAWTSARIVLEDN